jgi:hypothetical protein
MDTFFPRRRKGKNTSFYALDMIDQDDWKSFWWMFLKKRPIFTSSMILDKGIFVDNL